MSEKQILIGLVEAIGALAERLTGQRLEIRIRDEAGNGSWFYASDAHRWTTIPSHPASCAQNLSVGRPERVSMPADTEISTDTNSTAQ
jgi:hypothetical protein